MRLTEQVLKDARGFLRGKDAGVLTTMLTEKGQSYPFGTMAQYAVMPDGHLAVYISDIALHTRNAKANPHMGFAIFQEDVHQQAAPRLSVVGSGRFLEMGTEEYVQVSERYFSHFPEARSYSGTHNFSFCLIRPEKVHYIRTFGQIYTFEGEKLAVGPTGWDASGAISHMNEDHKSALVTYCQSFLGVSPKNVELINLDQEGFQVRYDSKLAYIPFLGPLSEPSDLRKAFVDLSEHCRGTQTEPVSPSAPLA